MAGFQQKSLQTTSGDGRNFHPLEWLVFVGSNGEKYRTSTTTDGGSTPWWIWWLIPPFGKKDWFSFILHDGCFRNSIQIWRNDAWHDWHPTEYQSNQLLYDALTLQGYGWLKKFGVYLALEWCGWRAFDEDRKNMAPTLTLRRYLNKDDRN